MGFLTRARKCTLKTGKAFKQKKLKCLLKIEKFTNIFQANVKLEIIETEKSIDDSELRTHDLHEPQEYLIKHKTEKCSFNTYTDKKENARNAPINHVEKVVSPVSEEIRYQKICNSSCEYVDDETTRSDIFEENDTVCSNENHSIKSIYNTCLETETKQPQTCSSNNTGGIKLFEELQTEVPVDLKDVDQKSLSLDMCMQTKGIIGTRVMDSTEEFDKSLVSKKPYSSAKGSYVEGEERYHAMPIKTTIECKKSNFNTYQDESEISGMQSCTTNLKPLNVRMTYAKTKCGNVSEFEKKYFGHRVVKPENGALASVDICCANTDGNNDELSNLANITSHEKEETINLNTASSKELDELKQAARLEQNITQYRQGKHSANNDVSDTYSNVSANCFHIEHKKFPSKEQNYDHLVEILSVLKDNSLYVEAINEAYGSEEATSLGILYDADKHDVCIIKFNSSTLEELRNSLENERKMLKQNSQSPGTSSYSNPQVLGLVNGMMSKSEAYFTKRENIQSLSKRIKNLELIKSKQNLIKDIDIARLINLNEVPGKQASCLLPNLMRKFRPELKGMDDMDLEYREVELSIYALSKLSRGANHFGDSNENGFEISFKNLVDFLDASAVSDSSSNSNRGGGVFHDGQLTFHNLDLLDFKIGKEEKCCLLRKYFEQRSLQQQQPETKPKYILICVPTEVFENAMRQCQIESYRLTFSNYFPRNIRMFISIPVYEGGFINRRDTKDRR